MTKYNLPTDFDLDNADLVSVFDELPLWAAPFGLELLEAITLKKNITALDIGFGAGFPILEIAQRLGNTCRVYGIDPWQTAIERTKKKIEVFSIRNVELIQGVAEKIPLENNSVDLITSNNGLNNVSDLDKTLFECSRIAKKNCQLVFSFNLDTTMIEFYDVMEKILKENELESSMQKMKEQIYSKRKPVKEWISLLSKHGFKTNQISEDKFEYRFIDGTALFDHFFIRLAFYPGWKSVVPKEKQDMIFGLVKTELNTLSEKNGFIKLSVPFVVMSCEKI